MQLQFQLPLRIGRDSKKFKMLEYENSINRRSDRAFLEISISAVDDP